MRLTPIRVDMTVRNWGLERIQFTRSVFTCEALDR